MIIATILSVSSSYYEGIDFFSLRMSFYYLPFFFLGQWIYIKHNDSLKIWGPIGIFVLSGCMLKLTDIRWIDSFFSLLMNAGIVVSIYLLTRMVSIEVFFRIPYMSKFLRNSFGIYLFHVPLIYMLTYYLQNKPIYIFFPVVGVAAILGSISLTTTLRKMNLQTFIGEKTY